MPLHHRPSDMLHADIQVLRRVWCLFEIWKTVEYKGVENLVVLAREVNIIGLRDIFLKLSVAEAQATVEADRLRIINDIRDSTGIEAMDKFIRQALVDSARSEVMKLEGNKEKKIQAYFQAVDKAGQMLILAGKYAEAEPMMYSCLEMCCKTLGEKHVHVASFHNNIAGLLKNQGKLIEAEKHQRIALEMNEALTGDSAKTANYLGNLAEVLQAMGKLSEAEPLLVRAMTMSLAHQEKREGGGMKIVNGVEVDSPDMAKHLNALASLYVDMGRPSDALPLYRRALAAAEASLPPQDPELSIFMANLAGVFQDLRRFAEAEDLQRQAVTLCLRCLGPEHPHTVSVQSNLAEMLGQQGKLEEAEDIARNTLKIRRKILGEGHPSTSISLNNLAGILIERHKYVEALPLMQQASEVCEKTYGSMHPMTANRLHNLATLLDEVGEAEESEAMFKRAYDIKLKLFGLEHHDTLGTFICLAEVYYKHGKVDDACEALASVVRVLHQLGDEAKPSLISNLTMLAMALHQKGLHSQALLNVDEAIKLTVEVGVEKGEEMTALLKMKDALKSFVEAAASGTLPTASLQAEAKAAVLQTQTTIKSQSGRSLEGDCQPPAAAVTAGVTAPGSKLKISVSASSNGGGGTLLLSPEPKKAASAAAAAASTSPKGGKSTAVKTASSSPSNLRPSAAASSSPSNLRPSAAASSSPATVKPKAATAKTGSTLTLTPANSLKTMSTVTITAPSGSSSALKSQTSLASPESSASTAAAASPKKAVGVASSVSMVSTAAAAAPKKAVGVASSMSAASAASASAAALKKPAPTTSSSKKT
ncbi:hypothetical protein CEUSTIGMA_g6459.t1 [Chlamydomonas eustigma]|uniref:MalT-like TPR region domain-containing protein n=1 Tax=Chlamydomonas eustigma TaxID=1157962 RepID=A0A250X7X5_9CHLO|nr:hypothetical protein CEUSTIGMA_g6459.t1 [Chlamydomonas eustigma]|eukprot:GAX79019.1 hypothetical protein CEUSTIGMA_g6459.t1 [Chlamydomonas eustigma]